MKKSIIPGAAIIALALVSTASYSYAQQATKTSLPAVTAKTAPQENPAPELPPKPQIIARDKVIAAEQPKPIVAGGEFKPMDTEKVTPGNTG